jgi:hypothetical protein
MARKAGQIITRGQSTLLVRVYLGRDPQRRFTVESTVVDLPARSQPKAAARDPRQRPVLRADSVLPPRRPACNQRGQKRAA